MSSPSGSNKESGNNEDSRKGKKEKALEERRKALEKISSGESTPESFVNMRPMCTSTPKSGKIREDTPYINFPISSSEFEDYSQPGTSGTGNNRKRTSDRNKSKTTGWDVRPSSGGPSTDSPEQKRTRKNPYDRYVPKNSGLFTYWDEDQNKEVEYYIPESEPDKKLEKKEESETSGSDSNREEYEDTQKGSDWSDSSETVSYGENTQVEYRPPKILPKKDISKNVGKNTSHSVTPRDQSQKAKDDSKKNHPPKAKESESSDWSDSSETVSYGENTQVEYRPPKILPKKDDISKNVGKKMSHSVTPRDQSQKAKDDSKKNHPPKAKESERIDDSTKGSNSDQESRTYESTDMEICSDYESSKSKTSKDTEECESRTQSVDSRSVTDMEISTDDESSKSRSSKRPKCEHRRKKSDSQCKSRGMKRKHSESQILRPVAQTGRSDSSTSGGDNDPDVIRWPPPPLSSSNSSSRTESDDSDFKENEDVYVRTCGECACAIEGRFVCK